MAIIAKAATGVSLATPLPSNECKITGVPAGQNLTAGDIVFLDVSGTWMRSSGSGETGGIVCMVLTNASTGEAVTAFRNVVVYYGPTVQAGVKYYYSFDLVTLGALDNAGVPARIVGVGLTDGRLLFTGAVV